MYKIFTPSRTNKPRSPSHSPYGRGQGEGRVTAPDRKIPLGYRPPEFCCLHATLPATPLPPPPAAPSRLPARVLRPGGARPGPPSPHQSPLNPSLLQKGFQRNNIPPLFTPSGPAPSMRGLSRLLRDWGSFTSSLFTIHTSLFLLPSPFPQKKSHFPLAFFRRLW